MRLVGANSPDLGRPSRARAICIHSNQAYSTHELGPGRAPLPPLHGRSRGTVSRSSGRAPAEGSTSWFANAPRRSAVMCDLIRCSRKPVHAGAVADLWRRRLGRMLRVDPPITDRLDGGIAGSRVSALRRRGRCRAARWCGGRGRRPGSRPRQASTGAARWRCGRAAARRPRSRY